TSLESLRQRTCRIRRVWALHRQPGLVDPKGVAGADYHGSLDNVLQLTNIAGPGISLAQFQRTLLYVANAFSHLFSELPDEVLDQQRNVFLAFPERRQLNGKDIQPVEQIRSECSPGAPTRQTPVARPHYTH